MVEVIIRWCHEKVGHAGRGITQNEIRNHGFWIVNGNSTVRWCISRCVTCRKLRGKHGQQKMGDLPNDRTNEAPPFTYCGVDMFGPFYIKQKRSTLKHYGIIFTCLVSRAVHLESVTSMETDSFLQALRRFISRRGNIRTLRCDNGTNFVGAENELKRSLDEMDDERIKEFLLESGTDWINWKKNTPAASHMGGVWERQIRTTRAILNSLLITHGSSLDGESFRTLLTEVEAIINSRPLTVEHINNPRSVLPISPNNLLTGKSKVVLPPPGIFQKEDIYCRKRWRRIQHLANEFWSKWRKSYLVNLQKRTKWTKHCRNFQIGDVVLLDDDSQTRNKWPMALVTNTIVDKNGDVRSVQVKCSSSNESQDKFLNRPINKLILLVEGDDGK